MFRDSSQRVAPKMGLALLSTNVGSLGDPGSQTRRNLLNRLLDTKHAIGKFPEIVGLQEIMRFDMRLSPCFGLPIATDAHVSVTADTGEPLRRGVATYAAADTIHIDPIDDICEAVATVHE